MTSKQYWWLGFSLILVVSAFLTYYFFTIPNPPFISGYIEENRQKEFLGQILGEKTSVSPSTMPLVTRSPGNFPTTAPILPTVTPLSAITSAPTSSPTVSPLPTVQPSPSAGLQNADFSAELTDWQITGTVSIRPVSPDDWPVPPAQKVVTLGSDSTFVWLGAHSLTQTFTAPAAFQTISFWYQVHTQETELGFDDPCLVVLLNDQVAWQVAAAVALPYSEVLENEKTYHSGWKKVVVPVYKLLQTDQPQVITFLSGQTGDQERPTWVEVTALSLITDTTLSNSDTENWLPYQAFTQQLSSGQIAFGQLGDTTQLPSWIDLLTRLQAPTAWHSLSLTTLVQGVLEEWQKPRWSSKTTMIQPDFDWSFSLSHEGFTALRSEQPVVLPNPIPAFREWWLTTWDANNVPTGLLWLDSIRE
jgi:hypothetical protein